MEDLSGIKKHIQDIIKSEHSVKVEIEFVSYGTIPKSENKMKRVVKV
jgi:phenylacetate-coenzyme A ligase PaaK-like adenylate-forming protein